MDFEQKNVQEKNNNFIIQKNNIFQYLDMQIKILKIKFIFFYINMSVSESSECFAEDNDSHSNFNNINEYENRANVNQNNNFSSGHHIFNLANSNINQIIENEKEKGKLFCFLFILL